MANFDGGTNYGVIISVIISNACGSFAGQRGPPSLFLRHFQAPRAAAERRPGGADRSPPVPRPCRLRIDDSANAAGSIVAAAPGAEDPQDRWDNRRRPRRARPLRAAAARFAARPRGDGLGSLKRVNRRQLRKRTCMSVMLIADTAQQALRSQGIPNR